MPHCYVGHRPPQLACGMTLATLLRCTLWAASRNAFVKFQDVGGAVVYDVQLSKQMPRIAFKWKFTKKHETALVVWNAIFYQSQKLCSSKKLEHFLEVKNAFRDQTFGTFSKGKSMKIYFKKTFCSSKIFDFGKNNIPENKCGFVFFFVNFHLSAMRGV